MKFVAGYANAEAVPEGIKLAIKGLVGHWFEHREAITDEVTLSEVPTFIHALLAPYRVWTAAHF